MCLVNYDTQAVSDLNTKETLAVHQSDCGALGDQQAPSRIYSGTSILEMKNIRNSHTFKPSDIAMMLPLLNSVIF